MLSSRLIRMVSDHWQEITSRVMRQIQHDQNLSEMRNLPEPDLRERAREILQNLGAWMVSKDDELALRYERLGQTRCRDGVPLHEVVRGLQIIKYNMIQWVRDQGIGQSPLEIYAEEELEHGADRVFDTMVYYVVRGYEKELRQGRPMVA